VSRPSGWGAVALILGPGVCRAVVAGALARSRCPRRAPPACHPRPSWSPGGAVRGLARQYGQERMVYACKALGRARTTLPCPRAPGAPRVKPCAPEGGGCLGDLGSLGGRTGPRRGTVYGSTSGGQPPPDRAALLVPSGKGDTGDHSGGTPMSTGVVTRVSTGRGVRRSGVAGNLGAGGPAARSRARSVSGEPSAHAPRRDGRTPTPAGGLRGAPHRPAGLTVSTRARTARLIASGRSAQAAMIRAPPLPPPTRRATVLPSCWPLGLPPYPPRQPATAPILYGRRPVEREGQGSPLRQASPSFYGRRVGACGSTSGRLSSSAWGWRRAGSWPSRSPGK
jgi:hypothetical protein